MWGGGFATVEYSYSVEPEEIIQLDEDVIFGGTLYGHFGHFISECWSRLWYVLQNPELKSKILFVTVRHGYKKWFDDFFRLMDIESERIIYVKQPTQCRSIAVPDQSEYNHWNYVKYTKEFLLPYQAIKSRVKPGEVKKLYLSRKNFVAPGKLKICCNEEYFEDFFAARGFKVVEPEKLTIEEQISLVMGADEIATTTGTLSHWAIFCKPTVKFIMLARNRWGSSVQTFINETFGIDNYFVAEAYKNFMYVQSQDKGVFFLGANKYWKEFVADYFGEKIDEDDDYEYLDAALDKYVNAWCKKYSTEKNLDVYISSFKDLCSRIVTLEGENIQRKKNRPLLTYQTHVDKHGWGDWRVENQFSNLLGEKRDIQAIKINFPNHKIFYSVYFNEEEGWSQEVSNGEQAGTTGKSKAIFGIRIRLDESGAKEFDIFYRAHKFDGTWTAWAKNGAEIYSDGQKLNSLQIKLEPKAEEPLPSPK